jgi:hypothetical protein
MRYLAVLLAIVAAIALSQLLVQFHDWNRQQACVTAGGRNCGVPRLDLRR